MAKEARECWVCEECGHVWLAEAADPPARCPSRSCRSTKWNASASAASAKPSRRPRYTPTKRPPLPASFTPPAEEEKPVYCRHGLNAAVCSLCRAQAAPLPAAAAPPSTPSRRAAAHRAPAGDAPKGGG